MVKTILLFDYSILYNLKKKIILLHIICARVLAECEYMQRWLNHNRSNEIERSSLQNKVDFEK